ncbi:hypothetical protein DAEQUDRAFT_731110 [Daedalea quercina L-15889]|uniref:Transcription factor TFIIIC triple barrel domain-containing protein n=1 Tax=Daedalea quercina L-15889 TaxID=1314783 RepID=A0A165MHF8_9APHY|nr:hypothetical protein DAEQUDRAFT_731110 [Daedalea quercina L-15889]
MPNPNTGNSSLAPGYKHVDAFGPDEEYESEEEVAYVTLDLGAVEPALVPSSSSFRLIGLDTSSPFLQLSGTVFKGQHQRLLGTELLFADAKEDNSDRTRKPLIHVGTSEQRIRFKEVEVKAKINKLPQDAEKIPAMSQAKGKNNKKDRMPETVEEVVGTVNAETQPRRRRGGRRPKDKGKGKGKGKEKAVDRPNDGMDMDDRGEGPSSTDVTPQETIGDAAADVDINTNGRGSPVADVHLLRQGDGSLVQWSSDAPEGPDPLSMDIDTSQ